MESKPTIVIVPAMGTQARFYRKLADVLENEGMKVCVHAIAGHRDDGVRPGHGADANYATMADDLIAELESLRQGGADDICILGHSLGGQIGALVAGIRPDLVDRMALVASCVPWLKCFEGRNRRGLAFLSVVMPAITAILGYFPGHRLGFAKREFRGVMADWRELVRFNRFPVKRFGADIDDRIRAWKGPVLSLAYACDRFAPIAARQALNDRFDPRQLTILTPDASSFKTRDSHFDWARVPDNFVGYFGDWLAQSAG